MHGLAARLLVLVFAVMLLPLARPAAAQTSDCSVLGQNTFVRDALDEYYLWYREVPRLNPARYQSPEAFLDALRYRPLDNTFSYIISRAEYDALFSSSQYIGLGLSTQLTGLATMRVSQTFADGPAAAAGVMRGDRILTINGRTILDLRNSGELGTAFGAAADGVAVDLTWAGADGVEKRATLVKRAVTIPSVETTRLYSVDGRRVGYIFFRNFVQPSVEALNAAFTTLREGGATELVLDLRYNGGGLVSVAQHLASLIGGVATQGQLMAEYSHNDKHPELNRQILFEAKPNALHLSRLVVITTGSSASASELIINALRPFIPVVVVGDTTYGKPVGQYGFRFCDRVLNPVSFILRNANGEADFFNGFPADCPAADDLDHQIGDVAEASLAEALAFMRTGACTPVSAAETLRLRARRPAPTLSGPWQEQIGAH